MFDLGWGEPVCVRETLAGFYVPKLQLSNLNDMSYPVYEGKPELVTHLKKMLGYKHILITAGTTTAINIVLRTLKRSEQRSICVTEKPFFPFYPDIIKKSGYEHRTGILSDCSDPYKKVILADIPSNPWGKVYSVESPNVIWDTVYANRVYVNIKHPFVVNHRVNVGSFSKMWGLTGLRLGWIGTNCEEDFELYKNESLYENCGISVPSQDLATDIFNTVNMDQFFDIARERVNMNRGEFQLLGNFFDGQSVPVNGMFFPVWVDNHGIKVIERANVKYIKLDTLGDSTLIRFNLAQNNKITRNAIKAIRTADRLKK